MLGWLSPKRKGGGNVSSKSDRSPELTRKQGKETSCETESSTEKRQSGKKRPRFKVIDTQRSASVVNGEGIHIDLCLSAPKPFSICQECIQILHMRGASHNPIDLKACKVMMHLKSFMGSLHARREYLVSIHKTKSK